MTSVSLRILDWSSLSSAKVCLVYLLSVVWSCYYQAPCFKNLGLVNWQDTPTRIFVTYKYSYTLHSICQISNAMEQSCLWQHSLSNLRNSLPFRNPKVVTLICCSVQIRFQTTFFPEVTYCSVRVCVPSCESKRSTEEAGVTQFSGYSSALKETFQKTTAN